MTKFEAPGGLNYFYVTGMNNLIFPALLVTMLYFRYYQVFFYMIYEYYVFKACWNKQNINDMAQVTLFQWKTPLGRKHVDGV